MAVQRLKMPVNYRSSAVRTSTPEPFDVTGGVALLAEAPADPSSPATPMVVTVGGVARTRVAVAPVAGQYRIVTQSVIGSDGQSHLEYTPLLQFHSSDDGQSGSADYYGTGTVVTDLFFSTLVAFLTPLTGVAAPAALPAATMTATLRGHPGDTAFLADGTFWFSDGASWHQVSGSNLAIGGDTVLGALIALALDAGYAGPALTGPISFDATHAFDVNAVWSASDAWFGALSLGNVLALTMDAVCTQVADGTFAATSVFAPDASWVSAPQSGDLTLGQALAVVLDAAYSVPGAIYTDNFDRVVPLYSGATTYAADTIVRFGAYSYRSLQASNVGRSPDSSPAWWVLYGSSLGSPNWSPVPGATIGGSINSNKAEGGGGGSYWNGVGGTIGNDHFSECDLVGAGIIYISVRQSSALPDNCYIVNLVAFDDGENPITFTVQLQKVTAGIIDFVAASGTITPGTGLRLEAVGNTLTVKTKTGASYTTVLTTTDSSFATGAPGLRFGGAGGQQADNWAGGSL